MSNSTDKIIVGLSGGVDSSVAALLLLEQGFEVEAVFMKNWDEDDNDGVCAAEEDFKDAQKVADILKIKLHSVNFSADYWDEVFADFLAEHEKGRTPNPDILCNQKIKFKAFLDYAIKLGGAKIATGHYARIAENDGVFSLKTGVDDSKDQSYFLYLLNQAQLKKSLFPLGEISKKKVREIAAKNNLPTADKKDSTGICFIGERPFAEFLNRFLPKKPGAMIDKNQKFIKNHNGLAFYTIGQRKGLGIGGGFGDDDLPWFVAEKRLDTNELVVVQGDDPLLYNDNLIADNIHWINEKPPLPLKCFAKIRYRQSSQACIIESFDQHQIKVFFTQKQRAITSGQSVVFYQDDTCLGGAIITK